MGPCEFFADLDRESERRLTEANIAGGTANSAALASGQLYETKPTGLEFALSIPV
jgi:hypothetical protein